MPRSQYPVQHSWKLIYQHVSTSLVSSKSSTGITLANVWDNCPTYCVQLGATRQPGLGVLCYPCQGLRGAYLHNCSVCCQQCALTSNYMHMYMHFQHHAIRRCGRWTAHGGAQPSNTAPAYMLSIDRLTDATNSLTEVPRNAGMTYTQVF